LKKLHGKRIDLRSIDVDVAYLYLSLKTATEISIADGGRDCSDMKFEKKKFRKRK